MIAKSVWLSATMALVLSSTYPHAESLDSISRPDIAAATCPTEWAALAALEPDLWADTNPIGIDPSLDRATSDAFNKYFLWVMAQADHIASITGLGDPAIHRPSYFDSAKAMYDLSRCLTMTPAEKDRIVDAYRSQRPSIAEDRLRTILFEAFDEYECEEFAAASEKIFRLDPQSSSFEADYGEIMSGTLKDCP